MGKSKQGTKRNVRQQGHDRLEEMIPNGWRRSKHRDKQQHQIAPYIYVSSTASAYHRIWNYYCDWLAERGYRPKTLNEAIKYVAEYIGTLQVSPGRWGRLKSASTVRTYFAAVAKVLQLSARDYDLPSRDRKDIRRSRGAAEKKPSRSLGVQAVQSFQRGVGLRNKKELQQLRGSDLKFKDGEPWIIVQKGKGGLRRECPVWGTEEEKQNVIRRMQAAGDNLVWPRDTIPRHYDAHADRAYYASRMYLNLARDTDTLPYKEKYICRRDMYGIVFDKEAMQKTSRALGHERLSILATNYLWRVEEIRSQQVNSKEGI